MHKFILVFFIALAVSCNARQKSELVTESGNTISSRFLPPAGYSRTHAEESSFTSYLRSLPLKPEGSKVKYYDGTTKSRMVYDAVIDMEIGTLNLQQCADAVIRLRAEYLYKEKKYDQIAFHFTNGFLADYNSWMNGKRIAVNGNNVSWKQSAKASNSYDSFRKYLDVVFSYAGTLSLSKELKKENIRDLSAGDVFIVGGSPGHAVIIVDVAKNSKGETLFLLAQSYMPAQEIQILKNPSNSQISPWYKVGEGNKLTTPEWTFEWDNLKRF